jgi:hypothetical protein
MPLLSTMDTMDTINSITKQDLERIETSLKKLIRETKRGQVEQQYVDMLHQLAETINKIKITVDFDHEKRIQAIEEFLEQL